MLSPVNEGVCLQALAQSKLKVRGPTLLAFRLRQETEMRRDCGLRFDAALEAS